MKIELRMFVRGSQYPNYPDNWTTSDCEPADKQCRALGEAHTQLVAENLYPDGSRAWIHSFDEFYAQYQAEFRKLKATRPPVLFFFDTENQFVMSTLKGSAITKAAIVEKYRYLASLEPGYDQATGAWGYRDTNGTWFPLENLQNSGGGASFLSIPLFNLPSFGLSDEIAFWAWAAAAGFFAFKTFDTDNPNKRAMYGSLAGISAFNLWNIKKKIDGKA